MADHVAIVGASCRLPGGIRGLDELWAALSEGRELTGSPPPDRFDTARFLDSNPIRPGKSYTFSGGFLDDIAGFDAEYFGISPREASRMDPQQRLLLELAVEALDDAGIPQASLAGSDAGVFVGASAPDYGGLQTANPLTIDPYTNSGVAMSNTANRLSHYLDLRGPSLKVDTACASSLNAVHLACEHLRRGGGGVALAAGVNILLNPYLYVGFAKATILSPSGRCRPFSAAADGYVRAEGGGVVVLKRLSAALADGDRVRGVVLASGTNTDGRTAGLVLPSAQTQEALLRTVYAGAGLSPDDLVYLEAHGTGTPVGDPIECTAIGRALGTRRTAGNPLPIGSVKANVGHLEPASGIAGLLKALLVLRHGRIPPPPDASPVNPDIDFAGLALEPVTESRRTERRDRALAGVNSFGFGGTNCHVVLTRAPEAPAPSADSSPLPVLVTARSAAALAEAATRMATRLSEAGPAELYDLAYTSCQRRDRYPHRVAVLAATPAEAARRLLAKDVPARTVPSRGRVAFAFCGNGSQWAGMGADLLDAEPVFRRAVSEVDELLTTRTGWSVLAELAAPPERSRLADTVVAQSALFAVQVGLTALLAHHGVRPDAVYGHSSGEAAAAYVAGALDLPDALDVVLARGRSQAPTAGRGTMVAVGADREQVERLLARFGGRLEIAAVNTSRDVTVAGPTDAVRDLAALLGRQEVNCQLLDVDFAFHSAAMDPAREPLLTRLAGLRSRPPRLTLVSTVTGARPDGELDAAYWWHNVRRPVLFGAATERLVADGVDTFVDVGPHPVLAPYLRRAEQQDGPLAVVPTLRRDRSGPEAVLGAVEALLAAGAAGCEPYFPHAGRVADLPAYPWQRERHWNGDRYVWAGVSGPMDHVLLGDRAAVADPTWQTRLDPARAEWLTDHRVEGAAIMPAAGYVEMALAAGRRVHDCAVEVCEMHITRPLALPEDDAAGPRLQVSLSEEDSVFRLASQASEAHPWQVHARARVRRLLRAAPPAVDVAALRDRLARDGEHASADDHYADAARLGLGYGPAFRVLTEAWAGHGEVLAAYDCRHLDLDTFEAHPAWLDGALQAAVQLGRVPRASRLFLPVAIGGVRRWGPPAPTGFVHVVGRRGSGQELALDLTMVDDDGAVLLELTDCRLTHVPSAATEPPARRVTELRAAPRPGEAVSPWSERPTASEVVAAAAARLDELAVVAGKQATRRIDYETRGRAVVGAFAAKAFGTLLGGAEVFFTDDLLAAGVRTEYRRLLAVLTGIASESDCLEWIGELRGQARWRLTGCADPEALFATLVRDFPEHLTHLTLLGRCARHLVDVLTGARNPVELVFPDEGAETVTHFYEAAPHLRRFNQGAAALVSSIVDGWPADRPLRVLEVGAGTGGLTAAVLAVLPRDRTRYTFTDVTELFFAPAKARFADFDFVEHRKLDLDHDPGGQGFTAAGFDLVLAANAVHAAKQLRPAVGRLAQLLGDGGQLLLIEAHDVANLSLPFGLFDGFWSFRDTDLRRTGPLLSAPGWRTVLGEHGFGEVVTAAEDDGFSLTLATRSGGPAPAPAPLPATDATWLVVDEAAGTLGAELAAALRGAGGTVRSVPATADWPSLLASADTVGVVHLLGGESDDEVADELATTVRRFELARDVAVACDGLPVESSTRFWLVSPPAGTAPPPERAAAVPVDAAAWGATRTVASEHPRLAVRRVSLDHPDAERLARELLDPGEDDEIVLTRAGRFVPRLVDHTPPAGRLESYRLQVTDRGPSYRLRWVAADLPEPGPGQVVVAVRAAAVNYRDTLLAAGVLPEWTVAEGALGSALGFECAGVVTAVGAEVGEFSPGDRVVAFTGGTFASHVVVGTGQVGHLPESLDLAEAVTMPVAVLSAHYGLCQLARLDREDVLLVHGAAGGVGLAALQVARHVGAEVIATAGTPEKRDFLRLLGVRHVFDSRSVTFAEEVRAATGGVDVVLNSLSGEAIPRSLELLRPGGRFVELGKRDIYLDRNISLRPFRRNVSLFGVDVDQLLRHRPRAVLEQYREVIELVRAGVYRPLPHRTFPAARIAEALRTVQHSRHIGKVVVTFDEPPPAQPHPTPPRLDPEATYLVTGGLSGFGGATAHWLADRGARHVALLSRRGAGSPEAPAILDALTARGVTATAYAADVADEAATRSVLDAVDATGRPLRGVVHAAMVLDDARAAELTADRCRAVLAPKMRGALVLDRLTRGRDLDLFLLYSSFAATVGNGGQANYSAANLFLEALARARRSRGLPATAVAWGAIGEVGYVARSESAARMLVRAGCGFVSPREAFTALDELLGWDSQVTMVIRQCGDLLRYFPHITTPRLGPRGDAGDIAAGADLLETLRDADPEEAVATLEDVIVTMIAGILAVAPERIDRTRPLDQLGVDSLMGAEMVASMRRRLGTEIPIMRVVSSGDVRELARSLVAWLRSSSFGEPR